MARIPKDHLESYFDHGVDITNRKVFLLDDIEEEGIAAVIKGLYLMECHSREKPIELYISSEGGTEYQMWLLFDVMRSLAAPVHTIAMGMCMSATPLLIAAGEPGHRYSMPNCWFMTHESSVELQGKTPDVNREIQHSIEMGDRWYEEMARLTDRDADFWRAQVKDEGDWYFNADTAVELGIVDSLWSEKDGE